MTDDEKCQMIARFEGKVKTWCHGRLARLDETANCLHPVWSCGKCDREFSEGFGYSPHEIPEPDYPHDLNATMRAAQRLHQEARALILNSLGFAAITSAATSPETMKDSPKLYYELHENDPARAAFEALTRYLMEQKPDA